MNQNKLAKHYKGKKVFVTGHTGFKGAWLTQILLQFGADVYGYSLAPNTNPNIFDTLNLEKKIKHQIGDIRDYETLNKAIKDFSPDIIFHLAAQPIVRDSYDNPKYTYEANVMGTVNALEAIRENKIKAGVIITTDKVYKDQKTGVAYKEDDPLGGYDPYSNSKACADLVVNSYIQSFFNPDEYKKSHKTLIASARAGNVIGGGDWANARLVPDAMKAFLSEESDLIIRSPKAIRPWQHVFEPLDGYLLLGMALNEGDKTKVGGWNFGPDDADMQSVEYVIDLIIKFLGKGKCIVEEDKTKHETSILKLDSSKAKKELGWRPRYNLKKAVEETAAWYREFYSKQSEFSIGQINDYFDDKEGKNDK